MDKAPDFGSGDCRFESCHARIIFSAPANPCALFLFFFSNRQSFCLHLLLLFWSTNFLILPNKTERPHGWARIRFASYLHIWLRGATVARLTPDQKAACSNHVGVNRNPFFSISWPKIFKEWKHRNHHNFLPFVAKDTRLHFHPGSSLSQSLVWIAIAPKTKLQKSHPCAR